MRVFPSRNGMTHRISVTDDSNAYLLTSRAMARICSARSVSNTFGVIHFADGATIAAKSYLAMKVPNMIPVGIVEFAIAVPASEVA